MKSCPDCNNDGFYIVPDKDGEPEQVQCQFCYTEPDSVFNVVEKLRSDLARLRELLGEVWKHSKELWNVVEEDGAFHYRVCEHGNDEKHNDIMSRVQQKLELPEVMSPNEIPIYNSDFDRKE